MLHRLDDIEGVDDLRWEDGQKLKKYVEGGKDSTKEEEEEDDEEAGGEESAGNGEYACENSKSSRAMCKSCNEKISKGEVSVSRKREKCLAYSLLRK